MTQITVEEATHNLSYLLEQVAKGEQFIIIKQGAEIARIVPPQKENKIFPSLNYFRNSINLKGMPMTTTIVQQREDEIS
jgi:antitoxin (DNA-binding transcriptional repressor) of toxin-antitoxin stability system